MNTDIKKPVLNLSGIEYKKQYRWNVKRLILFLFLAITPVPLVLLISNVNFKGSENPNIVLNNLSKESNSLSFAVDDAISIERAATRIKNDINQVNFWESIIPFKGNDNILVLNDNYARKNCLYGCTEEQPVAPDTIAAWPFSNSKEARPVISFMNDYRPLSMHHGLDITAKTDEEVLAIQPGTAHIIEASGEEARVQVGNFIYWHINVSVEEGQRVDPLKTVVGTVQEGFGHLHLSEVDDSGNYINPLRDGHKALPGWEDSIPPTIGKTYINGDMIVAKLFDEQSIKVRKPYITPLTNIAALAYAFSDKKKASLRGRDVTMLFDGKQNYDYSMINSIYDMKSQPLNGSDCYVKKKKCPFEWKYFILSKDELANDSSKYLFLYAWDWQGNLSVKRVRTASLI